MTTIERTPAHAYTGPMTQVLVHAGVVSSGLLALGRQIELQWQVP